jgi:hypothetical protein
MTEQEQRLADDKMRAVIATLIAETATINARARWFPFVTVAAVLAEAVVIVELLR